MKRFLILLSILFCTTVFAHTIEWYVDNTLLSTTTCESGDNITPPTAPDKYGYHFIRWMKYTPVEYLDINQGPFIEVNYPFNTGSTFETKLSILGDMSNDNGLFGNTWNTQSLLVVFDKNKFRSYFSKGIGLENTKQILKNTPYTLKVGNGFTIVDGVTVIGTPLNSLSVYKLKIPYSRLSGTFRFFYFKIYDNDVLVRDFIPILDSNGTPCMYDKVQSEVYYNAGTGNFIAGPAI